MPDSQRPSTSPATLKKTSPKAEHPKELPRSLFGPSSWNVPVGFTAPDKQHIAAEMRTAMEKDSAQQLPELHHKSSTLSQQEDFERSYFRNAVILCNV
jgi:hypothetical protein